MGTCNATVANVQRGFACEQLVGNYTKTVHVAAGIHVGAHGVSLFGAHVIRRTHNLAHLGVDTVTPQRSAAFGNAKVDDFDARLFVVSGVHQYVGRFQVAVQYPFLVGVGDTSAEPNQHLQPLAQVQLV